MQQGDVLLFQTPDDGDILVEGGIVAMSSGLETAAYVSLFGGNEDDDGRPDNRATWWGNLGETDPARQYRSETQNLLQAIPATSGNLRRVEDAARRDLNWMITEGAASSIAVVASIPALNRVRFDILIAAEGEEASFAFIENWKAAI